MWWLELHVLLLRNAIFKTFSSHFYNKFHVTGYYLLLLYDKLLLTVTSEEKINFNCKFKLKTYILKQTKKKISEKFNQSWNERSNQIQS